MRAASLSGERRRKKHDCVRSWNFGVLIELIFCAPSIEDAKQGGSLLPEELDDLCRQLHHRRQQWSDHRRRLPAEKRASPLSLLPWFRLPPLPFEVTRCLHRSSPSSPAEHPVCWPAAVVKGREGSE